MCWERKWVTTNDLVSLPGILTGFQSTGTEKTPQVKFIHGSIQKKAITINYLKPRILRTSSLWLVVVFVYLFVYLLAC